jgi:PAS domain S-box-containing protein
VSDQTQAVLTTTGDAAFAVDEHGRIQFWNAAAERLLGRSAESTLGQPCYSVLCGKDVYGNRYCADRCPLLQAAIERVPLRRFPLDVRTADGAAVRALVSTVGLEAPGLDGVRLLHLLHTIDQVPPDAATAPATDGAGDLTSREKEVLGLMAAGNDTRSMARALSISSATVRTHVRNILAKLHAHSRLSAVLTAVRVGLI